MWREGYDYPSDEEEQDECPDFFERADHDYEQLNDK